MSYCGSCWGFLGLNHLFNNDLNLSNYRYQKNWQKQFEHSIDPTEPQKKHPTNEDICSMCGKHCALSISQQLFNKNL